MALLSSGNMVSTQGATSLTLEAKANRSYRVTDVHVLGQTGAYATFKCDGKAQFYVRANSDATGLGNMIPYIPKSTQIKTILGYLKAAGIWKGYPVPTGTKFIVSVPTSTFISIEYDEYDANEVKETEQGGKHAKERILLVYGKTAAAIATATETQINTKVLPADFPDFPFSDVCPAKRKMEVLGLCASARAYTLSSGNDIYTTYLRMVNNDGTMFDPVDTKGFLCQAVPSASSTTFIAEAGYDIFGEASLLYQKPPYMFKTPLVFTEGQQLDTHWTTAMTGTGTRELSTAQSEICYIVRETEV